MTLLDDALFVVIDTETTGLDPKTCGLVEVAVVVTTTQHIRTMWASLVNPEMPIPPEVSAIHYLTDADVRTHPKWATVRPQFERFLGMRIPLIAVAHNAVFDAGFVDPDATQRWICTKRLAQHVWPDAPTFKNQGLRFWRKLKVDTFGILPHRALSDALVTAALLRDMLASEEFATLGITTVEGLYDLSQKPIVYRTWPTGKFRGQPIGAADASYMRWALANIKDDPDLIYTLQLASGQLVSEKGELIC